MVFTNILPTPFPFKAATHRIRCILAYPIGLVVTIIYLTKYSRPKRCICNQICVKTATYVMWFVMNEFDFGLIYLEIGFSFLIVLTVFLFWMAQITIKRKCSKCYANFAVEKIKSMLLGEEKVYETKDSIKIREIQNNTYKCAFCDFTETKKQRKSYLQSKNG